VVKGTYDELVSVLPVSVRLCLWATTAYSGRMTVKEAVSRTHPDIDHVSGDIDRLCLWQDLGERAVLVALPRPGNLTGMPRGSAGLIAAAADAGECVYVPGIGAALVPTIETFGPAGDQGTQVTWSVHNCEPVATHALDALSLSEIEQGFRMDLLEHTRLIEDLDVRPWASSPMRSVADEMSNMQWGLPNRLPPRAVKIITMAATVGLAATLGLSDEAQSQVLTSGLAEQRRKVLTHLEASADSAMAAAANVAAMSIAGLRPSHRDS
jgi:hypothetical protein